MSPASRRPSASVLLPDERIAWSSLLRGALALRSVSGDRPLPQPLALQMYGAGRTRQMWLDGSTADCCIVSFAHAAYRAIRVFVRWKYTASLGGLGSSLQRCPHCLSHGDGPPRGFGLAK